MKVLMLNGPPSSGKDEAVRTLHRAGYGFTHDKFADPLVRATMGFLDIQTREELERLKRIDPRVRKFMIGMSEEVVKPVYGPTFFGKACAYRLMEQSPWLAVVSDCGFQTEVDAFVTTLWENGYANGVDFTLWRIHRRGTSFKGDSREWVRAPLMSGMLSLDICNDGTLEQYEEAVLRYAAEALG